MPGAERRLLALPHRCAPGKVAARQAGRKPGRRRQGQPATAQAVSQMSGAGTPRAHSARCRLTVTQPVLGPGTWACRLSGPVAAPTIPTTRTPAPSPRQPGCSSRKLPGGLCPAPARAPGGGTSPGAYSVTAVSLTAPAHSTTLGSALAPCRQRSWGDPRRAGRRLCGPWPQASPGVTGVAPEPPEAGFSRRTNQDAWRDGQVRARRSAPKGAGDFREPLAAGPATVYLDLVMKFTCNTGVCRAA